MTYCISLCSSEAPPSWQLVSAGGLRYCEQCCCGNWAQQLLTDEEGSISTSWEYFAICAHPCVTKYPHAFPNWPITNQSVSCGCNQLPLPPFSALFWLYSSCVPQQVHTLLYVVYVAKKVLWRLQKAIVRKPVLARKINHMHICRTGSHTVVAVAEN